MLLLLFAVALPAAGLAALKPLLDRHWRPYLQGKGTLDAAIAGVLAGAEAPAYVDAGAEAPAYIGRRRPGL